MNRLSNETTTTKAFHFIVSNITRSSPEDLINFTFQANQKKFVGWRETKIRYARTENSSRPTYLDRENSVRVVLNSFANHETSVRMLAPVKPHRGCYLQRIKLLSPFLFLSSWEVGYTISEFYDLLKGRKS